MGQIGNQSEPGFFTAEVISQQGDVIFSLLASRPLASGSDFQPLPTVETAKKYHMKPL